MNAIFKPLAMGSGNKTGKPQGRKKRGPATIFDWLRKALSILLLVSILVPLALRWVPPPFSAFMVQALLSQPNIRYRWIPYQKISRHLPIAVVAAEDQKFPDHWGFDFNAIGSAIKENRQRKRPRGASTISQQVAKNLFLWSGRSYTRKGFEAYFTVMIELLWPKQRILEIYLNIAEFGPGVYGVEAASQAYFNKSANRLRKNEAALFAAVLPNPGTLRISRPTAYVRQRARKIERQMTQLGGITYLKDVWPTR